MTDLVVRFRPRANLALQRAALLHDAPEYVIGDLITPFKAVVGLDYKALEKRLLQAIHLRFGLPAELKKGDGMVIKRADRGAAFLEATQLAGFGLREAHRFFGRPRGLDDVRLQACAPGEAKTRFLERFEALSEETDR